MAKIQKKFAVLIVIFGFLGLLLGLGVATPSWILLTKYDGVSITKTELQGTWKFTTTRELSTSYWWGGIFVSKTKMFVCLLPS